MGTNILDVLARTDRFKVAKVPDFFFLKDNGSGSTFAWYVASVQSTFLFLLFYCLIGPASAKYLNWCAFLSDVPDFIGTVWKN